MEDIQAHLHSLKNSIRECEATYHRDLNSVSLLAVTKGQSVAAILQAVEAGQRQFGENYLQEALAKIGLLDKKELEWHFIGPIQSNKTRKISEHFSWVQSVSSARIAKRLNDQRPPDLPPLNICLEVNVSHEKTKEGASFQDIFSLADYCMSLPRLKLRGLMAIPAPKKIFSEQCAEFHKLKNVYNLLLEKGFVLDTLSIGMSNDWEAAVAEGSTMIRIGTKIFGQRN